MMMLVVVVVMCLKVRKKGNCQKITSGVYALFSMQL